jgi:hypothetical protein
VSTRRAFIVLMGVVLLVIACDNNAAPGAAIVNMVNASQHSVTLSWHSIDGANADGSLVAPPCGRPQQSLLNDDWTIKVTGPSHRTGRFRRSPSTKWTPHPARPPLHPSRRGLRSLAL